MKKTNLLKLLLILTAHITTIPFVAYADETAESIYYHARGRTISYNGKLYCFGGYSWSPSYKVNGANKAEVYDPETNQWAVLADMPETRSHFDLFELNGRIFLIGGQQWQSNIRNTVYAYNPETNSWAESSNYGTLPNTIIWPQCAKVDGKVYMMFGQTSIYGQTNPPRFALNDVYLFDPDNTTDNQWQPQNAPMPYPIEWGSVEVHNGKIYVFGCGHQETYTPHHYRTRIQIYDPVTRKWKLGKKLDDNIYMPANQSYYFDTIKYGNKAYLFASYSNPQGSGATTIIKDKVYVYNFDSDSWAWMSLSTFLAQSSLDNQALSNDLSLINNHVYFMDHYDFTRKKFKRLDLTSLQYLPCSPADEIIHNIDEIKLNPAQPYQVETTFFADNINSISSCEFQIVNPKTQDYIRIKIWNDGAGNWTIPQQGYSETYWYYPANSSDYPSEYLYLNPASLSATVTSYASEHKIKVLWQFKLNQSNVFHAGDTNLNYLLFRTSMYYNSIEKEKWTNEDSIPYFNNLTITPSPNKAIYLWEQTITLLDNDSELTNFLSFINAPHGNTENKINSVFFAFKRDGKYLSDYSVNHAEVGKIRKFISELHSRGIKAYYLAGDSSWAQDEKENDAKNHINAIYGYNSALTTVLPEERFDGIHFDIEPHLIKGFDTMTETAKQNIMAQFVTNLNEYANYINSKTWHVTEFKFGVSIPYWYEKYIENGTQYNYMEVTFNSQTKDVCKHVIDIADSVCIMNYSNSETTPSLSQHELNYATSAGSIYVALETLFNHWQDPGEYVTFGELGNTRLDIMRRRIENTYNSNNAFAGIAYHFYESSDKNGYHNLRLHESGARDVSSQSPVCSVITPNGGEVYSINNQVPVTFEVSDKDNDVVVVDVELFKNGVYYKTIGSNIRMEINPVTRKAVYTIDDFEEPTESSHYKIKVKTKPSSGNIESYDMSNFDFSINTNLLGLAAYYTFDEGDYNTSTGTIYDMSGNNNNATIINSSQAYPDCDGALNESFKFTGGSQGYLEVSTGNPLNGSDKFTISFWFKSDDLYDSSETLKNYALASAVSTNGSINSGWSAGLRSLNLWDNNGTTFLSPQTTTIRQMDGFITENQWHLYTAVYNGSNVIEYIDGINRLNAFKLNTPLAGSSLKIASSPVLQLNNFKGSIDELRIFKRAITEDEIMFIFNDGLARTQQEVSEYYAQQDEDAKLLSRRGTDADNDMLTNNDEDYGLPIDINGNILITDTDKNNPDNDSDNLSDYAEVVTYGSSPISQDEDNDGLTDYQETIIYNTNPKVKNDALFKENYESYDIGSDPNSLSPWFVFGLEHTFREIQGYEGVNKYLVIGVQSPYGNVPPAWAPVGIGQSASWSPAKDFTNALVAFDIRSNAPTSIQKVLGIQIYARCNETNQVSVFRVPNAKLKAIPSGSGNWDTIVFDIKDATYNEAVWKTPDFANVEKVEIIFMQTVTDFYFNGNIEIDNFTSIKKNN